MWDEGWLCRARPYRIETEVDLSDIPVYSTTGDFAQPKLAAATNDAKRNQLIVDAWFQLAHNRGRKSSLVFGCDVAHINALWAAFVANGIEAHVVHGKTTAKERANILADFKQGLFPVRPTILCSCRSSFTLVELALHRRRERDGESGFHTIHNLGGASSSCPDNAVLPTQ
jgi:superfamily II DNA or RNA helicase